MQPGIYNASGGPAIPRSDVWSERDVQVFFENNMPSLLDATVIASEFSFSSGKQGLRADTLAVDADGRLLVIEYKRHLGDSALVQAMAYAIAIQAQGREVRALARAAIGSTNVNLQDVRLVLVAERYTGHTEIAASGLGLGVTGLTAAFYGELIHVDEEFSFDRSRRRAARVAHPRNDAAASATPTGPRPRYSLEREDEIRYLYATGQYTYRSLADKTGVPKSSIQKIVSRG